MAGARRFDRRTFLRQSVTVGTGVAASSLVAGPAAGLTGRRSRRDRVRLTHGVQSGDVSAHSGVVWARASAPSRMIVDVSPTESFRRGRRLRGPVATPRTDLTAQLELKGLPPGRDIFYRISFADLRDPSVTGEAQVGHFRTAPRRGDDIRFVWGGDVVGQGWGINPDVGGMRMFTTMRDDAPDFFIHSGDSIYADGPLEETVTLPDGTIWRNVTTPAKSKVAETLDEFRGNYQYNLLDDNVRAFNAVVPIVAQWDDHETVNNWYPGEILDDPRYTVTDVDLLAARARRAFLEYMPLREVHGHRDGGRIYRRVSYGPLLDVFLIDMRTYRGPNTTNDQRRRSDVTEILGRRQLRWLQHQLADSRATWKVIASDMPIGLIVPDGETDFEAVANALDGEPLGRELEIAALLRSIDRNDVRNVVWLTADVHYAAAHRYDPEAATFTDFTPFWEFVSGPLNAGSFGPNELDPTFGPQVEFQEAAPDPNAPPSAGYQYYGLVDIAADTGVMSVALRTIDGDTRFTVDLDPA